MKRCWVRQPHIPLNFELLTPKEKNLESVCRTIYINLSFSVSLWRKRRASTVDGFRAVLLWLKVSPAALKFLSLLLLLAGMLNILRASLDSNGKTPLLFFHQPKRSRSSSMSWLRLMYWWTSSTVSFRGTFTHSSDSATTVLLLLLAGSTAGSPPPVKLAIRRLDSGGYPPFQVETACEVDRILAT